MITIQEDLDEEAWSESKRKSSSKFSTIENSKGQRKSIFGMNELNLEKILDEETPNNQISQFHSGKSPVKRYSSMQ